MEGAGHGYAHAAHGGLISRKQLSRHRNHAIHGRLRAFARADFALFHIVEYAVHIVNGGVDIISVDVNGERAVFFRVDPQRRRLAAEPVSDAFLFGYRAPFDQLRYQLGYRRL